MTSSSSSRRGLLHAAASAGLAASALAAVPAVAKEDPRIADVAVLNVALGLEWELIAAYQAGMDHAGLVSPVRDIAVLFQGHHKEHAQVLVQAIQARGGGPVPALTAEQYASAWKGGMPATDEAALVLVCDLERQAADGFVRLTDSLNDRKLSQTAARLVADESMHWTALSGALQRELPAQALTFGGA